MFNNIEEISTNKYLNSLDNLIVPFGLNGRFVECIIPGWEGMYFVCGKNVDAIRKGEFNITELLQRKARYNEGMFYTDIHIIPITDRNPFSVLNDVFSYARNVEFIAGVYFQQKTMLPDKITADGLNIIKLGQVNALNTSLSQEKRDSYTDMVRQAIENEKKIIEMAEAGDAKTIAQLKGSWDSTVSNKQNENNVAGDSPNLVSLEHLITRSGTINVISVRYDKSSALKTALAECPHAIYWMSAPYGDKLDFAEGQGFGSSTMNDLRKVYLAFDSAHTDEIRYAMAKALYPEVFAFSADFRSEKFGPISRLSIPVTQYYNFINLFKAGGIPFVYDKTCNSYHPNEINLVIPTSKEKAAEAVYDRLAKELEGYHIDYSIEQANFDKHLQDQLREKGIVELSSASQGIGGGVGE